MESATFVECDVEDVRIDGHDYQVSRAADDSGAEVWTFAGTEGGWEFRYDADSKTAAVRGIRPASPSPEWLDRGEADIRKVVRSVHPDAEFVRLDGGYHYAIGGPPHPVDPDEYAASATEVTHEVLDLADGREEHQIKVNGLLHDGPDGTPAVQVFDANESLCKEEHFRNGHLEDTASGLPAVLVWSGGSLVSVERYRRGHLNDTPDGDPAKVSFRPDGTIDSITHYTVGRLSDPPSGKPARVEYYPNGSVHREEHFTNGEAHNAPDGSPAVVEYYPGDGGGRGAIRHRAFLIHDRYEDSPDGSPAFADFAPDGSVEHEQHWRGGRQVS